MINVIARVRGVSPDNILPGAGSSDLIFRAFQQWLDANSRVLILDPTYGEYSHVLEQVIGCKVDRLVLPADQGYQFTPALLDEYTGRHAYDLAVIVNPISPTGHAAPAEALREATDLPDTMRREMGRRGHDWICEDFAWDRVTQRLAAAYARLRTPAGQGLPKHF